MKAFGEWFAERTGKHVEFDITDPANRMVVVWIFELLRGESVRDFANNFRCWLAALGLLDLARTILATNALELPAPAKLIERMSDAQRDAFQALCSASQLHFEKIEAGKNSFEGYRLSHPQIDWLLYREWASPPATLAQQWGRELAQSLAVAAKSADWTFGNKLIHALGTSSKLAEAMLDAAHTNVGTIDQALNELYRKQNVELLFRRYRVIAALARNGVQGLRDKLIPTQFNTRFSLAKQTPQPKELRAHVAGWLWRLGETDGYQKASNELHSAARSIIFGVAETSGVAFTLRVILSKCTDRTAAVRLAMDWLQANPTHPEAYITLNTLVGSWPQDDDILKFALIWLQGNSSHQKAYQLLAPLVAARPANDQLVGAALKWIEENPTHRDAYWLLAPLVAARAANDNVIGADLPSNGSKTTPSTSRRTTYLWPWWLHTRSTKRCRQSRLGRSKGDQDCAQVGRRQSQAPAGL